MKSIALGLVMIGCAVAGSALAETPACNLGDIIRSKYERVPLAHLPTPLDAAKTFSATLGGPPKSS